MWRDSSSFLFGWLGITPLGPAAYVSLLKAFFLLFLVLKKTHLRFVVDIGPFPLESFLGAVDHTVLTPPLDGTYFLFLLTSFLAK